MSGFRSIKALFQVVALGLDSFNGVLGVKNAETNEASELFVF
jgi:hypothetical protein